jgi:hypothetical protein
MLLQLEDVHEDAVNKLLRYAKENHLKLSLVDEDESSYTLPGKPLDADELKILIEKSRTSGIISLKNAHEIINQCYNAD